MEQLQVRWSRPSKRFPREVRGAKESSIIEAIQLRMKQRVNIKFRPGAGGHYIEDF
jgi:hypothetical protein